MTPPMPPLLCNAEVGSVVRTRDGIMRVMGHAAGRPLVCLVDADTDDYRAICESFFARGDLVVLEVLRDQTYYRTHERRGGGEVDPLKGR